MKYKAIQYVLAFLIMLLAPCSQPIARAQVGGTNSSYSRFGLGLLHDQSQGFNKSMGGVGLGVRIGNRINIVNPASYSAMDSLSLILDVGMQGSFGQMTQGTTKVGVNNASFDYAHIGMRLTKGLGLAAGFMPYTRIGYEFSSPDKPVTTDINSTQNVTSSNIYSGSGGLNQAYVGLGWKVYRDISIGANASFVWGDYTHMLVPLFKENGVGSNLYSSTTKHYEAILRTYKIDIGVQYPVRLTRQDWLNIGATASIGHKIAQDATLRHYTSRGDTSSFKATSPFDLPYSFGIGASWQHKNTLIIAADLHHEFWSKCRMPIETSVGYEPLTGHYMDRTRFAVGTQWTPAPLDKRYRKRIQYRAGLNYSTPYMMVDGKNGPKELSIGAGAALPITNRYNSRSVVNVGLQWLMRSASATGMVKENYLLINLGVTFNERWFMKYKIE